MMLHCYLKVKPLICDHHHHLTYLARLSERKQCFADDADHLLVRVEHLSIIIIIGIITITNTVIIHVIIIIIIIGITRILYDHNMIIIIILHLGRSHCVQLVKTISAENMFFFSKKLIEEENYLTVSGHCD